MVGIKHSARAISWILVRVRKLILRCFFIWGRLQNQDTRSWLGGLRQDTPKGSMSYRLILERLTIAGTSYQINQELSRHGAVATDPQASVVVAVENGKVKG